LVFFGKREAERGAFIHFSFSPYLSAMPADYPMDYRQAYAGSLIGVMGMETLEDAKKLFVIGHVKPNAVILQIISHVAVSRVAAHFDYARLSILCKLDGIGKKIDKHLPDERPVPQSGQ
jgi:hypothetical protein